MPEDNIICVICLSDVDTNEIKLDCSHIFHKKCMKNIIKCPLCRFVLIIDNNENIIVQRNECYINLYAYSIALILICIIIGCFILINHI